jgi:hypothetical protein
MTTRYKADKRPSYYCGEIGRLALDEPSGCISGIEYGWGGNDNFTAGSGQDYMFLWRNGNTVNNPSVDTSPSPSLTAARTPSTAASLTF